jgi:hypothetical protein
MKIPATSASTPVITPEMAGHLASNRSSKKPFQHDKNRKFFAEIRFAHLVLDRYETSKELTHETHYPMPEAYKIFSEQKDGRVKAVLKLLSASKKNSLFSHLRRSVSLLSWRTCPDVGRLSTFAPTLKERTCDRWRNQAESNT